MDQDQQSIVQTPPTQVQVLIAPAAPTSQIQQPGQRVDTQPPGNDTSIASNYSLQPTGYQNIKNTILMFEEKWLQPDVPKALMW